LRIYFNLFRIKKSTKSKFHAFSYQIILVSKFTPTNYTHTYHLHNLMLVLSGKEGEKCRP